MKPVQHCLKHVILLLPLLYQYHCKLFAQILSSSSNSTPCNSAAAEAGASISSYLSSWAPLVPTPIAAPRGQSLILSSSLPSITAKVIKKIKAKIFVEFKELPTGNVMLLQQIQQFHTTQSWGKPRILCYLSFMAVKTKNKVDGGLWPDSYPFGQEAKQYGLVILWQHL